MSSTSACAAGERKDCAGVGVGCDLRGAGDGAGAGAAVRWSSSESSGSEEGDGGGGAAGRSGATRFLGPAGRVGLFGNRPRPVVSIGGGAD
jgi:hypothetical protein